MINLRDLLILLVIIVFANGKILKLQMPGVMTKSNDEYVCAPFAVPNYRVDSYIVSYEPLANSSVAHHMLLFGCSTPFSTNSSYPCSSICEDNKDMILFGWARDAKSFHYPPNTGMAVGGKSAINYFVLQVHYLKPTTVEDKSGLVLELTTKSPEFVVGIFLLFSYYGSIPPKTKKVNLDVSCRYKGTSEAYALAFRTHAHTLGRSISGFRASISDGQIELIGKGNPQWPQTFYKSAQVLIKPGDILMARCLFDSSDRDTVTEIGFTHMDEMCNFYIMLVTKNTGEDNGISNCGGNEFKDLWKNIPSYSMEYDPPHPPSKTESEKTFQNYNFNIDVLKKDNQWQVNKKLGEVSGVSILSTKQSKHGYSVLVLHRGSHFWTETSFVNDVYQDDLYSPITENTIVEVDPVSGNVLREAARDIFFMPHGITATKDGKYLWITDVALHQVMRFNVRDDSKLIDKTPSIVLGERFVPGSDRNHFCKPSQVAVDSRGYIFVADGYCNNRVVCFYPNGTFIEDWQPTNPMFVVHSITIKEDDSGDISKNIVYVADREKRKIIGFGYDGVVKFNNIFRKSLPIYGIEYNSQNKLIYGVTSDGDNSGSSFTFNTTSHSEMKPWNADYSFRSPHDLCLADNGKSIFVAELHLKKVIKFQIDAKLPTDHHHSIGNNFNQIHDIVKQVNPIYIGVLLMAVTVLILVCIVTMKYYRRCQSGYSKKRRYGKSYKDKEGFKPLNQEDDDNEDGNSDPETEEYPALRGHLSKKPKV